MANSYYSYRIKWIDFFIGVFMPHLLSLILIILGYLITMSAVVALISCIIGIIIWLFWYVMKQVLLAISAKGALARNQNTTSTKRPHKPPGIRLLLIVTFLYSPRTVEETFRPIVADWRTEYFDALKQKRNAKARWICFRYYWQFAKAMGLSRVYSMIKDLKSAGK